jgi:hypothetical protein
VSLRRCSSDVRFSVGDAFLATSGAVLSFFAGCATGALAAAAGAFAAGGADLTALWLAVAGGATGGLAGLSAAALLGVAMAGAGGLGAGAGAGAGATVSTALGGCTPGGLTPEQPDSKVKASPIIDATRMGCPRSGSRSNRIVLGSIRLGSRSCEMPRHPARCVSIKLLSTIIRTS